MSRILQHWLLALPFIAYSALSGPTQAIAPPALWMKRLTTHKPQQT